MNKNSEHEGLRTWVEIDSDAAKHNLGVFRSFVDKETKIMAIVKSNAYGHGLWDFSKLVDDYGADSDASPMDNRGGTVGVDWFGVDSIVEALTLRKNGIKKPILVLGYTLPERFKEAIENDISLAISSFESLKILSSLRPNLPLSAHPGRSGGHEGNSLQEQFGLRSPIKIHLKIDTGMHRQGFLNSELDKVCKTLKNTKIEVEGMFTHFASAKNPSFPQVTNNQIELFDQAIKIVEGYGFKPIKHAAATGGTLLFPKSHYDMVRIGIGLYGLWPAKEVMRALEQKIELKPVLTWKTIIGEVKILPEGGGLPGQGVGYDLTEKLPAGAKIAICPIGYWHGYTRSFSSVGNVLVGGERAKIIGRVSMDMIIIDVSKIKNVRIGDEVVILGRQGKNEITADEMAYISDTTNYEIVTRINPLIKRIVV